MRFRRVNPDQLRNDETAVSFVRAFVGSEKPVATICHGPWTLVEADVVRGRTVTSWPSLATDLRNAGAEWVDQEVVVDGNLVTSRKPDDLDAFCGALVQAVRSGRIVTRSAPVPYGAGVDMHEAVMRIIADAAAPQRQCGVAQPCERHAWDGDIGGLSEHVLAVARYP